MERRRLDGAGVPTLWTHREPGRSRKLPISARERRQAVEKPVSASCRTFGAFGAREEGARDPKRLVKVIGGSNAVVRE